MTRATLFILLSCVAYLHYPKYLHNIFTIFKPIKIRNVIQSYGAIHLSMATVTSWQTPDDISEYEEGRKSANYS